MTFMTVLRAAMGVLRLPLGSLHVFGRDNIPGSGAYMLVTNHMSKADPPLILVAFRLERIRFFAGEKWESHLLFGPIMRRAGAIYVNRGEVDRKAIREAQKALEAGSIFGLAPEGTRSRVGALIEAKDGAAYLAAKSRVPLLPVGLVNTDLIGSNLRRLRRTRLEVHIGRPFRLPEQGGRPKSSDLAAYTHLIMVQIAAVLPERHRGFYAESPALQALLAGEDPWPYCLAEATVSSQ